MKNLFLRLSLFALFSFVLTNVSYAQTHTYGEGCLGTWCYVDVSLSDPTNAGELIYVISTPPEGFAGNPMGPGSPSFFNYWGSTVELHLKKSHLFIELDGQDFVRLILDVQVNKYVSGLEPTLSTNDKVQCHYHIILNVTP